jgi:phosphatidylserine decarboxylase
MMEVGALMVGKIVNHPADSQVRRAQEKGHFMFGGSTVIMVFEKGAVNIDKDILENSENDIETVVRYGMKIGEIN